MLHDYEKCRSELSHANKKNEDLLHEIDHMKTENRHLDSKLSEIMRDHEHLKQNFTDKQSFDQREIK